MSAQLRVGHSTTNRYCHILAAGNLYAARRRIDAAVVRCADLNAALAPDAAVTIDNSLGIILAIAACISACRRATGNRCAHACAHRHDAAVIASLSLEQLILAVVAGQLHLAYISTGRIIKVALRPRQSCCAAILARNRRTELSGYADQQRLRAARNLHIVGLDIAACQACQRIIVQRIIYARACYIDGNLIRACGSSSTGRHGHHERVGGSSNLQAFLGHAGGNNSIITSRSIKAVLDMIDVRRYGGAAAVAAFADLRSYGNCAANNDIACVLRRQRFARIGQRAVLIRLCTQRHALRAVGLRQRRGSIEVKDIRCRCCRNIYAGPGLFIDKAALAVEHQRSAVAVRKLACRFVISDFIIGIVKVCRRAIVLIDIACALAHDVLLAAIGSELIEFACFLLDSDAVIRSGIDNVNILVLLFVDLQLAIACFVRHGLCMYSVAAGLRLHIIVHHIYGNRHIAHEVRLIAHQHADGRCCADLHQIAQGQIADAAG